MKLVPVRNLATRAITSFDVFVQILFNGDAPQKFDPNKYYEAGDLVYTVDENGDNFRIMQAAYSGFSVAAVEPNWTEYSISKVLEEQLVTIRDLTGIKSKISDVVYNTHSFYYTADKGTTRIDNLEVTQYENGYHYCELYVNGKFISVNRWEITDDTLTMDESVVPSDGSHIVIRVNEANSLITRMVNRFEMEVTATHHDAIVNTTRNLLKPNPDVDGSRTGFTTVTCNSDGSYTVNGTTTDIVGQSPDLYIWGSPEAAVNIPIPNLPYGGHLTFSGSIESAEYLAKVINVNGDVFYVKNTVAFTTGMKIAALVVRFPKGTSYTNQNLTVQLEVGQEATDYVAYGEKETVVYEPVAIPWPITPSYTALQYDLYINGQFVPNTKLTVEVDAEGAYFITNWPMSPTEREYVFTFEFAYSSSNEVVMLKQDYALTVEDDLQRYLLDLSPVNFVNSFQEIKVFNNGQVVDPGRYILGKGRLSIEELNYYFNKGDQITVSVWTYVLPAYVGGTVRHNSQSVPIVLEDTLRTTVPFLDWDVQRDDLMVFNDTGIYLSNCKWYLDGNDMQYFKHDSGIASGDIIDFRMIDQEKAVTMQNIYVRVNADNQNVFETNYDLTLFTFIMLFTSDGEYIPANKYTISGNRIQITGGIVTTVEGDLLELVGFKLVSKSTTTIFSRKIINGTGSGGHVFINPYNDYNPSTDSLIIFTNSGQYVGERFYIANDKNITLLGSGVALGEYLEVIMVRNLGISISNNPSTETIDKGDMNLNDVYTQEVATSLKGIDLVKYKVMSENDANYLRVQATDIKVTATCNGVEYPADLLFSGTRCLLSIDTVDPTDPDFGVHTGDTIDINIHVTSASENRLYVFGVYIDPKTLHIVTFDETSSGESLIIPGLQKLFRAFPLKNITGMTNEVITRIRGTADVVIKADKDGEALTPYLCDTPYGDLAIHYGDITSSGIIKTELMVYNVTEDYQYKFTINVTKPWRLIFSEMSGGVIELHDLEDDYLQLKQINGKTEQLTTRGENIIDLTKFNASGVTIDSIDEATGSITITSDGVTKFAQVNQPLLGLVDETATYVFKIESRNTSIDEHTSVDVYLEYGVESTTGKYFACSTSTPTSVSPKKETEINLGDYVNITSLRLRIVANNGQTTIAGPNTFTVTGLQMYKKGTVDKFEPYTGLKPAPNPEYKQEIKNAGTKTYNLLDLSDVDEKVSSCGVSMHYDSVNRNIVLSGVVTTEPASNGYVGAFNVKDVTSLLVNGHTYAPAITDSNDKHVIYNYLITASDSTETYSYKFVYNAETMTKVTARIGLKSAIGFDYTGIVSKLSLVDLTENPNATEYKPFGYEINYTVENENFFEWKRVPTNFLSQNGVTLTVNGDGSFTTSGLITDTSKNGAWYYLVKADEIRRRFRPGNYLIVSQDDTPKLSPYVYLNAVYDGVRHSSVTVSREKKIFQLTEEILNKPDLYFEIGIFYNGAADITHRTFYPMLLCSDGDGSEWVSNENGMYVAPEFVVHKETKVPLYLNEPLRGRDIKRTNIFDYRWLDRPAYTNRGMIYESLHNGSFIFRGAPDNDTSNYTWFLKFTHAETLDILKPGTYCVMSNDDAKNMNPRVVMSLYKGEVAYKEVTSRTWSLLRVTEDDLLDQDITFRVAFVYMGKNGDKYSPRIIFPGIYYSPGDGSEWGPTVKGELTTPLSFVPCYATIGVENTGNCCSDMIMLVDGKYQLVRSIRKTILDGSDRANWARATSLDPSIPRSTCRVGYNDRNYRVAPVAPRDSCPGLHCDTYTTVSQVDSYKGVAGVSTTNSEYTGLTFADSRFNNDDDVTVITDFLAELSVHPIEVQYPLLVPVLEPLPDICQEALMSLVGYRPKMRITTDDVVQPEATFTYKLRVDGE